MGYDRLDRGAGPRQPAVDIVRELRGDDTRHAVDHHNAGARVERTRGSRHASRRDNGHVADPAEVLKRAPFGGVSEQERVGDRDQRRALPRRGDVAHAEVAHDVYAGALGDHCRLPELPRRVSRFVPHRLSVTRDRRNIGSSDARLRNGGNGSIGKPVAEIEAQPAVLAWRGADERAREPIALRRVVRSYAHA